MATGMLPLANSFPSSQMLTEVLAPLGEKSKRTWYHVSSWTTTASPQLFGKSSAGKPTNRSFPSPFACQGGTKSFSCSLDGQPADDQPGAMVALAASQKQVSAKGVCVQNGGGFRMRVRLWDTATGLLGAWSEGFDKGGNVCVDGDSLGSVAKDHPLVLVVSPEGAYPASFRSILYDPDATSSALFSCSGWTAKYECSIQGARRLRQVFV